MSQKAKMKDSLVDIFAETKRKKEELEKAEELYRKERRAPLERLLERAESQIPLTVEEIGIIVQHLKGHNIFVEKENQITYNEAQLRSGLQMIGSMMLIQTERKRRR